MKKFWCELIGTLNLTWKSRELAQSSELTAWWDECGADRFNLFCGVPDLVRDEFVSDLGVALFLKTGRPALINVVCSGKNDD